MNLSQLSDSEFSRACGVSPASVSLWIKGVYLPKHATALKISRRLGIHHDELLYEIKRRKQERIRIARLKKELDL